jgi:hypothetical protein
MLAIQFVSFINHVLYTKEWLLEFYETRKLIFFCYLNSFTFLKRKNVCMIEKMIKNELSILSFGLNFYKILNLKR